MLGMLHLEMWQHFKKSARTLQGSVGIGTQLLKLLYETFNLVCNSILAEILLSLHHSYDLYILLMASVKLSQPLLTLPHPLLSLS
jgi:hypothetical protein